MTTQEQKEILTSIVSSVAVLTTQQSILINLVSDKLPDVAWEEKRALANSRENNFTIANELRKAMDFVHSL